MTAAVIVVAALVLAGASLFLSFEHVAVFAHEELGFRSLRYAQLFTATVDVGIMVLIGVDLLMAWLKRSITWVRYIVWLLTGVTIVLNASSASPEAGQRWQLMDYVATFAHATVPVLFIVVVEVGRTAIDRVVRPETGQKRAGVPLYRWLMAPWPTWALYRRMRLWEVPSYEEMVRREKERTVYRVMLERQHGSWKKAPADMKLPLTLASYGLSVQEALLQPEEHERRMAELKAAKKEMEADTKRREQELKEAEEDRRAAEERRKAARAAELEKARLRAAGSVETARREVEAEEGQAAARARAAVTAAERTSQREEEALDTAVAAEARARAAAAERQDAEERARAARVDQEAAAEELRAAQMRRQAAEENKAAEVEMQAIETAAAAEARARAAEEDRRAAEAERAAAETRKAAAEEDRRAAEAKARKRAAAAETERAERAAAETRKAAAEARRRAAEIELRAVELEDTAKVPQRERTVRKVARVILADAGGNAERLPLEAITNGFGVSVGTASAYRQEAAALIADGYRPEVA